MGLQTLVHNNISGPDCKTGLIKMTVMYFTLRRMADKWPNENGYYSSHLHFDHYSFSTLGDPCKNG